MVLDHAWEGICINAVCPDGTGTNMLATEHAGEPRRVAAQQGAAIPTGRVATGGEVAFLAFEEMAFVPGPLLPADRGSSAQ